VGQRAKVILAFACVYVIWGSTYLAIRVGVADIPAALFAAARFVPGGLLMLLGLAAFRRPVKPARADLGVLLASAVLLLVSGNGLVILAERTVPSGPAALVVATVPLWITALEAILPGGERLAARGVAGIVLGLLGLVALTWPQLTATAGQVIDPGGIGLLVIASISWAGGTLLMRRRSPALDPLSVTAWQMLLGGLVHLMLWLLFQRAEPVALSGGALRAIAYLIVFGSWIGYTAFVWLVRHVPAAKVATYAYVNPVIAVLLGWLVLQEPIDAFVVGGMLIILLAVMLVNSARVRAARPQAVAPVPPAPPPEAVPAAGNPTVAAGVPKSTHSVIESTRGD
jgi:drug/metabolite transporter (DMT)-like permease